MSAWGAPDWRRINAVVASCMMLVSCAHRTPLKRLGGVQFSACDVTFTIEKDLVGPDFRTYVVREKSGARVASAYVGNAPALGLCRETSTPAQCDASLHCSVCQNGDDHALIVEYNRGSYVYFYDIETDSSSEWLACALSGKAPEIVVP